MLDTNIKQRSRQLKFREKPMIIEALQWTGNNAEDILNFAFERGQHGPAIIHNPLTQQIEIATLEGKMSAHIDDWIIIGVVGECYPCKPDIFLKTYERINED